MEIVSNLANLERHLNALQYRKKEGKIPISTLRCAIEALESVSRTIEVEEMLLRGDFSIHQYDPWDKKRGRVVSISRTSPFTEVAWRKDREKSLAPFLVTRHDRALNGALIGLSGLTFRVVCNTNIGCVLRKLPVEVLWDTLSVFDAESDKARIEFCCKIPDGVESRSRVPKF